MISLLDWTITMSKKVVILIGGPSGSGKSTLAKEIIQKYLPDAVHLEADNYFMVDGEYKFDINKLGAAHKHCESLFRKAIAENKNIIVSNTLTTEKEINKYLDSIPESYDVLYTFPPRLYNMTVADLHKSNKHGVPIETIEKQKNRWSNTIDTIMLDSLNAKLKFVADVNNYFK